MGSSYRLLAVDVDGTLLDSGGRVADRDATAIHAARRRGVRVTLCTGRLYSGTVAAAREIGVDGPVCCMDGSTVFTTRGDEALQTHRLPAAARRALRATFAESGLFTFLFEADRIVYDQRSAEHTGYVGIWSPAMRRVDDVLDEALWDGPDGAAAVVAVGDRGPVDDCLATVSRRDDVQSFRFEAHRGARPGLWGLMVRAAGVSKGTALRWIAARHGIPMSEVVAVGDWVNDIPMFRAAGRSFAMGQSPEEVKRSASDVLEADSEEGGGVAEALERAGLL